MKRAYIFGILALLLVASLLYGKTGYQFKNFELAGGSEQVKRGFPQREIVDLVSLFPNTFYRGAKTEDKKVALSFDDGPDKYYTVKILDVLKENDVPATFFLIGKRCKLYPDVVKRMQDEGHVIGNHTYNHPNIMKISEGKVRSELNDTSEIINDLVGYEPALFRSPYGSLDPKRVKLIANEGYKIIAWNVDSLDWKGLSAAEVKTNILENVVEGSIILQHSAGGKGEDLSGSVEALAEIIKVLKEDGYEFVTVDKLLDIPYKR